MSDTPRTDALLHPLSGVEPTFYLVFEHSRTLERENAELRRELAELKAKDADKCIHDGGRCGIGGYCEDCPLRAAKEES